LGDRESQQLRLIETELERRRAAAADAWELIDQVVLVGAGEPITVPGRGDGLVVDYPGIATRIRAGRTGG
jgi:hypothetical protein